MVENNTSFRTNLRVKLPPGMVYPVSCSILQEKLSEVPQKECILVNYYHYRMTERRLQKTKAGKAGQLKNRVKPIIRASYLRSEVSLVTPNWYLKEGSSANHYSQDKWTLAIDSVSVSQLQFVRDWLEAGGYAQIRDWFIETNKFAGSIGSHSLMIGFKNEEVVTETSDSY